MMILAPKTFQLNRFFLFLQHNQFPLRLFGDAEKGQHTTEKHSDFIGLFLSSWYLDKKSL